MSKFEKTLLVATCLGLAGGCVSQSKPPVIVDLGGQSPTFREVPNVSVYTNNKHIDSSTYYNVHNVVLDKSCRVMSHDQDGHSLPIDVVAVSCSKPVSFYFPKDPQTEHHIFKKYSCKKNELTFIKCTDSEANYIEHFERPFDEGQPTMFCFPKDPDKRHLVEEGKAPPSSMNVGCDLREVIEIE